MQSTSKPSTTRPTAADAAREYAAEPVCDRQGRVLYRRYDSLKRGPRRNPTRALGRTLMRERGITTGRQWVRLAKAVGRGQA